MLERLRDLPFKHKLTAVVTAVSAISLILSSAILLSRETLKVRRDTEQDLRSIAGILGANSVAALEFEDQQTASENLAGLELKPQVVSARLFSADGRVLATFVRPSARPARLPERPGPIDFRSEGGRIRLFETVAIEGELVGTVFIEADAGQAWSEMRSYALTILLAGLVSGAAAFALSQPLQAVISRPVEQLTNAGHLVAESGDYSVRVPPAGRDELGVLTDAFNRMLGRIQDQDGALRAARDELEQRVEERVREVRREIADRRLAEAARHESEQRYRSIVENTSEWIWSIDADGRWTFNNGSVERVLGHRPDEILGTSSLDFLHPEDRAAATELLESPNAAAEWSGRVFRWRHKDGSHRTTESVGSARRDGEGRIVGWHGIDHDITQRLELEEQLRQSQKMEAVGRLAGGIAHDFNNLLSVILGYSGLVLKQALPAGAETRIEQVRRAAERAASLTRQLLAFSRRQVLDPKVLDLNGLVADLARMLPRLLGEDMDVVLVPGTDLWRVRADAAQIDQVLLNLAVNARDAMPGGGRLTIETSNAVVDEPLARRRPPLVPGRYVLLRVADTGRGMDTTTLSRIFEPFFTTKPVGKGTGLGLSTVYGVVSQSGGHVLVQSQLGLGTTFEVYLPRVADASPEEPAEPKRTPEQVGQRGTVLVAEDEDALRGLTRETLEANGYVVLTAGNGEEALDRSRAHKGPIDLLLTDVVMPGFSGKVLSELLTRERPGLQVLYMSGYTTDAIDHHGVLDSPLLQKPFDEQTLIARIRQVLTTGPQMPAPTGASGCG